MDYEETIWSTANGVKDVENCLYSVVTSMKSFNKISKVCYTPSTQK